MRVQLFQKGITYKNHPNFGIWGLDTMRERENDRATAGDSIVVKPTKPQDSPVVQVLKRRLDKAKEQGKSFRIEKLRAQLKRAIRNGR